MSDDKRDPCDYCHACSTDVYALGGCYCKRSSHPSLAPRTESTLRTAPQVRDDWVPPVAMARYAAEVGRASCRERVYVLV